MSQYKTSRRGFLSKIFSSAVAAPAVAGIIARGNSGAPCGDSDITFDENGILYGPNKNPLRVDWTRATEDVPHELVHNSVRYIREMTATEFNLSILRSTHFPRHFT